MKKRCLKFLSLVLAFTFVWSLLSLPSAKVYAADGVELFTSYRELTSSPGESISYSIELINYTSSTQVVDLKMVNKENWQYELTAGGKSVQRLAVKSGDSTTLNLRLDVPLQIEKGTYTFQVAAGSELLDLVVNVAEKGTFQSSFEVEQANMEGYAGSNFTFTSTLRNQTANEQTYALSANPPAGWEVRFKIGSNYVSSVALDVNATQTVTIEAKSPEFVEAGTYTIPVAAFNNMTTAETELSVQINGSYNLTLSTSDERLNTDIRAGGTKTVELVVTNTGTADLEDVSLSSVMPTNWEVTFEPKTIDALPAGESKVVQAVITSSEKALPGDYIGSITAKSSQKSDTASLRMTVKTSVTWGWIGVAIILVVIGVIYFLFRKYGRR